MDRQKRKAAVVGALNMDIGGRPSAPLAPGDSIPGTVTSALGGVGWNIARDCALLGARTSFISLLGWDGHADVRAEASRLGLDLSAAAWTDEHNDRYLYICDERGDVAAAVNDMRLCLRIGPAFVRERLDVLNGMDAVAADANLPAETLAVLAAELKVPLAADCVSAAKCVRLAPILRGIHTLKANRREAAVLTGEEDPEKALHALLAAGVKRAVISLGAEGIICGEGEELLALPSPAAEVVDATGAGDALTAALTVGLAAGMDLRACAELGLAAAQVTLAHPGSVTEALRTLAPDM